MIANKYKITVLRLDQTNVRFIVEVPNNHYIALGFGSSMRNCDMVVW